MKPTYRAFVFDFYSVWAPDRLSDYLVQMRTFDPQAAGDLEERVHKYYYGMGTMQELADAFNYKFRLLGHQIDTTDLFLHAEQIPPEIIRFLQYLHSHFLKVGVLANIGQQERQLLEQLQKQHDVFDAVVGAEFGSPLLSQPTFAAALRMLGEPPENCVVISGHEDYLSFAANLGMPIIRFEGFPKLMAETQQLLDA